MTASLIEGPAIEPVSLDEAKAQLRLDGAEEDALLAAAIAAARIHVEAATRRALISQRWRVFRDEWPRGRVFELPVAPLLSVDQVIFYDVAGVPHDFSPDDYRVDLAALPPRIIARARPAAALYDNGIEIELTAGYGTQAADVPAPLRQAMLMLVAHFFEHRAAILFPAGAEPTPLGFDALVAPFRLRTL